MRKLSISKAWDETKAILARDGKLYGSVALALIGFPSLIAGLLAPENSSAPGSKLDWTDLAVLIFSILAVAGQLAIVRLAIGPSATVGEAIAHGFRRMPALIGAVLLAAIAVFIPLVLLAAVLGLPFDARMSAPTPRLLLLFMILFVALVFVGVRMLMSAPVASAEQAGPIGIIRRSWALTAGSFWPLFGFLVTFLIAAAVVLIAVVASVGAVVGIVLGPVEPMSASALVVALVQAVFNALVTLFIEVMTARIYVQLAGRPDTIPADA